MTLSMTSVGMETATGHMATPPRIRQLLQMTTYAHLHKSIGPKIDKMDDWWEAVGDALRDFNTMAPEIKAQLDCYCDSLPSGWVTFSVYIIGKSKETASPTIMFFCPQEATRKAAIKAIKKSRILKKYPGFKMGHKALEIGINKLELLAESPAWACDPPTNKHVFYDPAQPITRYGLPIFVKERDGTMRKAIANRISDGQRYFYVTVSHIFFERPSDSDVDSKSCDNDYEIEGSSDSEVDDEESDEDSNVDPQAESEQSPLKIPQNNESDIRTLLIPRQQPQPAPGRMGFLGELVQHSHDKDWALISTIGLSPTAITIEGELGLISTGARRIPIRARVPSGDINGELFVTPSWTRLPHSNSFQEVYKIRLERNLKAGDCGIGIFDMQSYTLYGIVIAGSQNSGDGYIMAAYQIFKDMEAKLGNWLILDDVLHINKTNAHSGNPRHRYGTDVYHVQTPRTYGYAASAPSAPQLPVASTSPAGLNPGHLPIVK